MQPKRNRSSRRSGFDVVDVRRKTDAYSLEAQLSGQGDRFDWITGLFYYVEDSSDWRFEGTSIRNNFKHELNSIGVFGQGSLELTDRFSATLGLRYTSDEKEIGTREAQCTTPFDASTCTFAVFGDSTDVLNDDEWSAVSGRLALEYQLNDDVFLFGSYARGFRAGGLNDRPVSPGRGGTVENNFAVTSFDEEILDVYEAGIRSEWFDNRLRANVTYFFQDMGDLQFNFVVDPTSGARAVGNAAEAESSGIEAEFLWAATDDLTFDLNLGTLDATIIEAVPSTGLTPGETLSQSPELQYALGATHVANLLGGEITSRIDYTWVDDAHSTIAIRDRIVQEAYGLLGFDVNYKPSDGNWSLGVYGTNVTDEYYTTFQSDLVRGPRVIFRGGTPARGSEFGVKASVSF